MECSRRTPFGVQTPTMTSIHLVRNAGDSALHVRHHRVAGCADSTASFSSHHVCRSLQEFVRRSLFVGACHMPTCRMFVPRAVRGSARSWFLCAIAKPFQSHTGGGSQTHMMMRSACVHGIRGARCRGFDSGDGRGSNTFRHLGYQPVALFFGDRRWLLR